MERKSICQHPVTQQPHACHWSSSWRGNDLLFRIRSCQFWAPNSARPEVVKWYRTWTSTSYNVRPRVWRVLAASEGVTKVCAWWDQKRYCGVPLVSAIDQTFHFYNRSKRQNTNMRAASIANTENIFSDIIMSLYYHYCFKYHASSSHGISQLWIFTLIVIAT